MGICKKILNRLRRSRVSTIDAARSRNIQIGEGCHIYSELPSGRDCFLLSIGSNVTISGEVVFLLHDAAIGTMTGYEYTDYLGRIVIGDGCFIGYRSTILLGVTLPRKTLVAAGSVVTKSPTEEGMIIAGVPAKPIGRVCDYIEKAQQRGFQLDGLSQDGLEQLVLNHSERLIKK